MADERPDVQIEMLEILTDGRALKAVGFSLPYPGLAGNGDCRAAMLACGPLA
jgi:hypothetical protein